MSDNKKRILEMLANKKVSVDEAYRLLNAVGSESGVTGDTGPGDPGDRAKPKYLRVTVLPSAENGKGKADRVNIRVPMSLIRAGMKLKSLIPPAAMDKVDGALKEKGIDFDVRNIKPGDLEELIDALGELQVDIDSSGGEKVKVFVE
jgi:hypothetical protein